MANENGANGEVDPNADAGGDPNGGDPNSNADGGQGDNGQQQQPAGDPPSDSPFAELQDEATRTWLEKVGVKDVASLAKKAHEADKLIGNAIHVPGKDASDEEKEAFLNKLGRPEAADKYDLPAPEDMPEDLPYDGERADAFKAQAHKLGLSQAQAKGLHDWFIENTVTDFRGMQDGAAKQTAETAKGETEKLVKMWGPLDGDQMKTNLSFADKALKEGGKELHDEFQRVGLIGSEGNMILSAPIAAYMAKVGRALYKEDEVLRGNPAALNNPFEQGEHFNVTNQMRLIKSNRAQAMSMIAAAGKKPSDFGLND